MKITSRRQYDLAKRDRERITLQITNLSAGFDTEIEALERTIEVKKSARDQATAFLRSEWDSIRIAMEEWENRTPATKTKVGEE
mgnify:CR=1 FL=1